MNKAIDRGRYRHCGNRPEPSPKWRVLWEWYVSDLKEGHYPMRGFLGMIVGALLTVAGAYAFDNFQARGNAVAKPMVNWDVVRDNWNGVQASLRDVGNRVHDEWVKRSG
jgi:hypothetical protein